MTNTPSRRDFLKASLFGACGATFAAGCSSLPGYGRRSKRPNIVVVFSDDATPSYHSCYGGRTPTPAIDSIATEGALFNNAFCVSSLCCPSRQNLLTGQFVGRAPRVIEQTPEDEPYKIVQNANITPRVPCLGRIFSRAGYRTGFLGKWHSNWEVKEAYPEFETIPRDADPDDPEVDSALRKQQKIYSKFIEDMAGFDHVSHVIMANHVWLPAKLRTHNVEWMTQGALDFIDEAAQGHEPFLLYVADTLIHSPNTAEIVEHDPRYTPGGKLDSVPTCHPPRSTVRERAQKAGLPFETDDDPQAGMQMGMIMLDDQVRAIQDKLRELNIEDNTIVVYAADNGIYGKGSAYYSGAIEPLLIKWPGKIQPGTIVEQPVSFVDIAPTLMAAAGIPVDCQVDGINLLPAAMHGENLGRDTVYMELGYTRAVLKGRYHYVAFRPPHSMLRAMENGEHDVALDHWGEESKGFTRMNAPYKPHFFEPDQLYDIEKDPFERNNLAHDPAYADILKDIKAELGKYLSRFERPFPLEVPPFMESEAYQKLVAARWEQINRKVRHPQGYDAERIMNLNLPEPAAE